MGKLAYRTADDEFKTFVGHAYRHLYGDGALGELPDETLDKIEKLTSQRIDSLTKYLDIWLEREGLKRLPKTSIAYFPVNDFDVYCEMERAGVPPFRDDRYDVMALCVLKAAKARDREGCMKTGALLAEYVGAKSMFDDKAKETYQHGKKMKPADAAKKKAEISNEATDGKVREAIEKLGKKASGKAVAIETGFSEPKVSRSRKRLGI